jgi:ubiquinol-cytochrome c reductase cytochrome c1 subunit
MVLQRFARGLLFLGVSLLVLIPNVSVKAAGGVAVPAQDWSFSGVFGTFDRGELQRGFHV